MSNRIDGEIIRGVINDPRLFPGIKRSRAGASQLFGERIVKGGKLIQECDFELTPPVKSGTQRKLMGFGIGLRVAITAMVLLRTGRIADAKSMMFVLIAELIESTRQRHKP